VVKELLDNALDAGATEIEIEIVNGGASLIKISDNGSGILAEDLLLALEPHTTSKLENIDDLLSLETLGFRGEALASISAVSRLTLESKHKIETSAWQVALNDGGQYQLSKTVLNGGTVLAVADLFYNVPARQKFLKQAKLHAKINHRSIPKQIEYWSMIGKIAAIYPLE
jgi:DNA mismatch repair protein MutL